VGTYPQTNLHQFNHTGDPESEVMNVIIWEFCEVVYRNNPVCTEQQFRLVLARFYVLSSMGDDHVCACVCVCVCVCV
jgi:hypothetical protein